MNLQPSTWNKPVLWTALAALLAAALVAAGLTIAFSSPSERHAGPETRTDVEPLRTRFAAVGDLSDPHWLGYNPRETESSRLPEQDPETRVVGVARLPHGAVRTILDRPGAAFRPADLVGPGFYGWPNFPDNLTKPPEQITPHLPGTAKWVASTDYDTSVTHGKYRGRFYFDEATDTFYFDTVNP
ncbi:hypothetical protein [Actinocrispum wychmicini]|uniref:hypothetical protein n=1 Tax=Actinocrispum wychmicini TaxID=1213861 RepID=UPI001047E418|nr:hypothetical protein [Actinocrispum wychmicini]